MPNNYLGRRSFRPKVTPRAHTNPRTHRTSCITRIIGGR